MEMNQKKEAGKLSISDAVIEKIARLVVNEVDGVYSMAPSPLQMKDILFSSGKRKSIRLTLNGGVAAIDVYVVLKAGYRIKDVAESIQEYVKDAVQNMASVTVSKVNVYVRGVETASK